MTKHIHINTKWTQPKAYMISIIQAVLFMLCLYVATLVDDVIFSLGAFMFLLFTFVGLSQVKDVKTFDTKEDAISYLQSDT